MDLVLNKVSKGGVPSLELRVAVACADHGEEKQEAPRSGWGTPIDYTCRGNECGMSLPAGTQFAEIAAGEGSFPAPNGP